MNRKLLLVVATAATALGLVACDEQLAVTNPNAGETQRVLGTANDAEALLGTYYRRWSSGVYGSTTNLEGMTNVMSLMNYSSLNNSCQNNRTPFSGAANGNAPGNNCFGEQYRLYQFMGEVQRVASSFLSQAKSGAVNLGSPARDNRAKSYAEFLRGISLGYTALMYDSSAIISEATSGEDPGTLANYTVVADSAYAAFDRAIAAATAPSTGPNGFPLPNTWIPTPNSLTAAEFVRVIRSYRARIRANMARTPAQRGTVNWDAVIADAQGGITADHNVITNTVSGPGNSWRQQYYSFANWHQMPPFFIGMADTSGAYAQWIGTPVGDRGANGQVFSMATPDLRFPQGTTRAAQAADFSITSCTGAGQVCKRYFVNRAPAGDQTSGLGFGFSAYDMARFASWNISGDAGAARNGATVFFTKVENDMLLAEGLYRKGDFAGAAALVNVSRTRNGLPAIPATIGATGQVPGGNACVPKVPVAPNFTTVACGTLWDALKYEKRIETAYTHYAPWFLDGRGWGELPKDTPLFWATPYQDLQARGKTTAEIYGAGLGAGNAPNSTAALSVYGW